MEDKISSCVEVDSERSDWVDGKISNWLDYESELNYEQLNGEGDGYVWGLHKSWPCSVTWVTVFSSLSEDIHGGVVSHSPACLVKLFKSHRGQ